MSVPATEIAVLTLKPNTTIEDASTPAGQIFQQMLQTIQSQAGFQRQYWGRQLENPNHLVVSIDWHDIHFHHTWMQTASYRQFFLDIAPLRDLDPAVPPPSLIHLNCHPHPPDAPRVAPVTELAFFALPASASTVEKSALEDAVVQVAQTCLQGAGAGASGEGVKATSFARGWVVEEMDAGTEGEGNGKAISLGLLLGWEAKEAQRQVKETEGFRTAVQAVRELALSAQPGRAGYHVRFVGA